MKGKELGSFYRVSSLSCISSRDAECEPGLKLHESIPGSVKCNRETLTSLSW